MVIRQIVKIDEAKCEGVREATVDLGRVRAVVTGRELGSEEVLAAVTALGYAVKEVPPHFQRFCPGGTS